MPFFNAIIFLYIILYTLNIGTVKKMSVNEIRDFIFKKYYKQIEFSKESCYYSVKHLKRKDSLLLGSKLIEKDTCSS